MKQPRVPKKSVVATVMALLLAGGGGVGYVLVRDHQADIFENSMHEVVRVIDGDTIELENDVRIRLLGLDAPESNDCFYEEAKAYLEGALSEGVIKIRKDVTGSDRYNRLLRYVYVPADSPSDSDVFINYELLRQGFARSLSIAPDTQYRDLFSTAESQARNAKRGGWAMCEWLAEYHAERPTVAVDTPPPNEQCVIKGNISEKSYGKNYFVPGCPNYNVIKISPEKGEQYFCTEEEAVAAGFTRSASCR